MANVTGSGPATTGDTQAIAPVVDTGKIARWGLGIVGVWLVLTFAVDLEDLAEVAAALAVLIATSTVLAYGPTALRNLGFLGG